MSLEMPRVRLLIADDVGLGKTVEAGLILTELLARQMASCVLVIVPANLREQWRLDYIMDMFPIVKRKDEERYGEYRTKRIVLEKYEELESLMH